MIRLYKDNPGEVGTERSEQLRIEFAKLIEPFLQSAVEEDLCMRDLRDLLTSEISLQVSLICLKKAARFAQRRKADGND